MSTNTKAAEAGANISRTPLAYEKWPAWEPLVVMFDPDADVQEQLAVRERQGWTIKAVIQGTCYGLKPLGITVFMERPFGMNWREGIQSAESTTEPKPKPVDAGLRSQQSNVNGNSSKHGGRR